MSRVLYNIFIFCLSPKFNVLFGFKGVVTSGSLVDLLALRMGKTHCAHPSINLLSSY